MSFGRGFSFSVLVSSVVVVVALLFASACGGKVVVDAEGGEGGGGSGAGSGAGGPGDPPLKCGDEPEEGKIVAVCVSMGGGDFCPPAATSPGLLSTLADAMGVCAKTNGNSCCNKPALVQVVCDLPPSGDQCCYHAHYFENISCP